MANEQASRDNNDVPTLLGVSSSDGTSTVKIYADPTTHRLLVDSAGGGTGTVTSVSVVTANGFAGTVATAATTPAITLSTTVTGILLGNGTSISAASPSTDYAALAFKTISVSGQSDVVADSPIDTLTLVGGTNITITTNASTDTITIAASGSGGTPGGLNAQIQYNNAGSFGGISGATTDGSAVSLSGAHLLNPTINGAGAGLATLAYPNTASNATITLPATTGTVALTSDLTGKVTAVSVSTANGFAGSSSGGTTPALTLTTSVNAPVLAGNGTAISAATTTGTGSTIVLQGSPTITTAALGSSTATTQSPSDNSTKLATTAYVDAAVLGQNFKEATLVATTANLVGVYLSGVFTYTATGTNTVDGVTLALGNRVLVKNQTTTFQNGWYAVTTAGTIGVAGVLTRSSDANTSGEFKTGDSSFVTSGTANSNTTWAYTGIDSPTLGTDAITYAQTAGQGSFTQGAGITITGNSIALTAPVTVALGGTNATSASITAFNNITGYSAAGATGTTSTNLVFSTSPSLTTPALGVATATSINGNTFTTGTYTLTGTAGKTLNFTNTITFSGTDSTTMTFPATSATVAGLATTQTFTGQDKFNNFIDVNQAVTVSSNAGTVPVTFRLNTFTNSSAATMAITMATASAVDGQMSIVRIYDFSAVAQTIGWTNTENSTVIAPLTSNGSTTLPLTVGFMYNSATSKWRCIASA